MEENKSIRSSMTDPQKVKYDHVMNKLNEKERIENQYRKERNKKKRAQNKARKKNR
jgi:hypothetical protein